MLAPPVAARLRTWRNFWGSRLPYCARRSFPTRLPQLACDLLDQAAGGFQGPHADADVTRLQEVVKFAAGK